MPTGTSDSTLNTSFVQPVGYMIDLNTNSMYIYILHQTPTLKRSRYMFSKSSLQWRQNEHDGVSNHQPHVCLLNSLFRRRSKKTSKFRVAGHWAGNSPVTGEFPTQRASNAENVSIWWRHHVSRWKQGPIHPNVYSCSHFCVSNKKSCPQVARHHQGRRSKGQLIRMSVWNVFSFHYLPLINQNVPWGFNLLRECTEYQHLHKKYSCPRDAHSLSAQLLYFNLDVPCP